MIRVHHGIDPRDLPQVNLDHFESICGPGGVYEHLAIEASLLFDDRLVHRVDSIARPHQHDARVFEY